MAKRRSAAYRYRAVILGALAAVFIAAVGFPSDQFVRVTCLVSHHFPVIVFGALLIFVATVNPLLSRLRPGWALSGREIAIVVFLALTGCSIPSGGLMKAWYPALAVPVRENTVTPGWKENGLLDYVRPELLPARGNDDLEVIGGWLTGLSEGDQRLPLSDVPWHGWVRPLLMWTPLILLTTAGVICLSIVLHSQWSEREHLRYPIADVVASFIRREPGKRFSALFYQPPFLRALALVFLVHLVNGCATWDPARIPSISFDLNLTYLLGVFDGLRGLPWAGRILNIRLFLTVAAFGFLLPGEIGFTLTASNFLFLAVMSLLAKYGINVAYDPIGGGLTNWSAVGASIASVALIFYSGRFYYTGVLRRAVGLPTSAAVAESEAMAGRGFMLASSASVLLLIWFGLQWPLAILLVVMIYVFFTVCTRLSAEAGQVLVKPAWQIPAVFAGIFGISLGPQAIILIGLVNAIMCADVREALMPFTVNGLKLCSEFNVSTGRTGFLSMGVYTVALAVAIPVVLWAIYTYGGSRMARWSVRQNPLTHFRVAQKASNSLAAQGLLEDVRTRGPMERVVGMRPQKRFIWAALVGFAGTLLLGWLRFRIPWWPLHPLLFLVAGSWPVAFLWPSFALGWVIRAMVRKYCGIKAFEATRVAMLGVIAGDLLGGLLFIVIGFIVFATTGNTPPVYRVFP